MPKGQQRSNREHKKPKQQKKPPAPPPSFIKPGSPGPMTDKKK